MRKLTLLDSNIKELYWLSTLDANDGYITGLFEYIEQCYELANPSYLFESSPEVLYFFITGKLGIVQRRHIKGVVEGDIFISEVTLRSLMEDMCSNNLLEPGEYLVRF